MVQLKQEKKREREERARTAHQVDRMLLPYPAYPPLSGPVIELLLKWVVINGPLTASDAHSTAVRAWTA